MKSLNHPEVLAKVNAEVDAHLDLNTMTPEMFMAMPTLHGAAMETLRMHTIALAQPRVAAAGFHPQRLHDQAGQPRDDVGRGVALPA